MQLANPASQLPNAPMQLLRSAMRRPCAPPQLHDPAMQLPHLPMHGPNVAMQLPNLPMQLPSPGCKNHSAAGCAGAVPTPSMQLLTPQEPIQLPDAPMLLRNPAIQLPTVDAAAYTVVAAACSVDAAAYAVGAAAYFSWLPPTPILTGWLARNTRHPPEPYTGPRLRRSSQPPARFCLSSLGRGFLPGGQGGVGPAVVRGPARPLRCASTAPPMFH